MKNFSFSANNFLKHLFWSSIINQFSNYTAPPDPIQCWLKNSYFPPRVVIFMSTHRTSTIIPLGRSLATDQSRMFQNMFAYNMKKRMCVNYFWVKNSLHFRSCRAFFNHTTLYGVRGGEKSIFRYRNGLSGLWECVHWVSRGLRGKKHLKIDR